MDPKRVGMCGIEPNEHVRGRGGGGGMLTLDVGHDLVNPIDASVDAAAVLSKTFLA